MSNSGTPCITCERLGVWELPNSGRIIWEKFLQLRGNEWNCGFLSDLKTDFSLSERDEASLDRSFSTRFMPKLKPRSRKSFDLLHRVKIAFFRGSFASRENPLCLSCSTKVPLHRNIHISKMLLKLKISNNRK